MGVHGRGQRTTIIGQFSPSTAWMLALNSLLWAWQPASAFTYQAVMAAPFLLLHPRNFCCMLDNMCVYSSVHGRKDWSQHKIYQDQVSAQKESIYLRGTKTGDQRQEREGRRGGRDKGLPL